MPSRTEQSSVLTSDSGQSSVTFAKPFFIGTTAITGIPKPVVNITPLNTTGKELQPGDNFVVDNITGTGFTVHFKNSSGGNIVRDFTYNAVGFGKGV